LGLGLIYTFDEYLRPSLDTGEGESQKAPVLLLSLLGEGWDGGGSRIRRWRVL